MYTQCSKCETVFKISAEVLRVAGGQVRCGKCGEVFNALARLAEDSNGFSAGESPLDLEARADRILEAPVEVAEAATRDDEEFAPPGIEIAHLEVVDWTQEDQAGHQDHDAADDDRSMEFTLPPGELDRIFVESKKRTPLPMPPPAQQPVPPPTQQPSAPPPVQQQAPPPAHQPPTPAPPAHPESAAVNALAVGDRVTGFEVPEDVRRDMLAGFEQRRIEPELVFREPAPRNAQRQLMLWLGAAIVSALLLIVQVVWGVTGDPDANGTLKVRASILNTAAQLQPYPLLRVTLADRFGKRIGTRDFEPSEYLGKPIARLLTPGERVDATLEILDPGKNAEGFEIDVCLRSVDKRISCANDVAPQTQR